MSILNWLTSRFNRTDGRRHRDEDIRREVKSHLDLETEEQLEAGLAPGEARNTARRLFGNDAMLMEDVRAIWTPGWMERFCSDLRYAARSLRKSPGFTIVAVATLTLGIGANTAIFSAIDAVMLRPLPFSNPDQIVRIYSTKGGALITGFAYPGGPSGPDLRDFADNSHSFEKMIVYDQWRKNVSFADAAIAPEQMHVGLVPAAYFEILGMRPIMGRFFTDDENQKGRSYVAAISARLWRERFARDRAVLGRKIIINGESYE
ncbi:MAG TPA: ABC transporter permease, partial [Blastocatellia bacterium]|nr:ABC transporter permease [Blastocatellia bacterium]